jgi:hypothetical protein
MTTPFVECAARLGWTHRFGQLIFYPDVPTVSFALTPVFPGCSDTLAYNCIVWNLWYLIDSVRRPGTHWILTCECGYSPDAEIEWGVLVSHPNENTVVWELDFAGLAPVCDEAFRHLDGFMRLTFDRTEYESDVRAMLREVQQTTRERVPFDQLVSLHGHANLEKEYPGCRHAVADRFEPTTHGDCDADEFLELDADAPWPREPMFAPGTVIELGNFRTRVNGKESFDWIGRWFTRWEVLAAYRAWTDYTNYSTMHTGQGRQYRYTDDPAIDPGRKVIIKNGHGEALVNAMRKCFAEGNTAPGVDVRYVQCDVPLPE